MLTGTDQTYEVWERRTTSGNAKRRHPGDRGLPTEDVANIVAKNYNDDEAELAKTEGRKVRTEYFVVKATTSFAEVGAEAQVDEPAPTKVEFFYTKDTPYKWSTGPTVVHGDPDNHYLPIETLERAKELAEEARRGTRGYEDYVATTYGVKAETKIGPL